MGLLSSAASALGIGGGGSAPQIQFNPWDVNSGVGSATFEDQTVNANLSPEMQEWANSFLGQMGQNYQGAQNAQSAAQGYYDQAANLQGQNLGQVQGLLGDMFGDVFEKQRLSQESRLYNQGLLGSTTGAQQSQALNEAQNQSLINATLGAQNQFFNQGSQLFGQGSQLFNQGNTLFNQGQGAFGSFLNLQQMPLQLAQLGGQMGQGQMDADSFNAQAQMQADSNKSGFFSNLLGAGIGAAWGR